MKVNVNLILIKRNQILLQLRESNEGISWPGYWNLPGGDTEEGEDAVSAVRREFKEETGYILKNPVEFKKVSGKDQKGNQITLHYFYENYDGKQPIHCYEGSAMEFTAANEIETLKIIPFDLKAIRVAIKKLML